MRRVRARRAGCAARHASRAASVYSPSPAVPAAGTRCDRVDRIAAVATTSETSLKLDLACEVFALAPGERFTLALASSLRLDGKPDADYWEPDGKPTLLDQYDYGMAGKVFKYEYMGDRRV